MNKPVSLQQLLMPDGHMRWLTNEEMAVFKAAKGPIIMTERSRTVIPHLHNTLLWGPPDRSATWIAAQAAINAVRTGGRVMVDELVWGNRRGIEDFQDRLGALAGRKVWWDSVRPFVGGMQGSEDHLRQSRNEAIEWLNQADDPLHSLLIQLVTSRTRHEERYVSDFLAWNFDYNQPWDLSKPDPQDSRTWESRSGARLVVVHESETGSWEPLDAASCFYDLELRAAYADGQIPWTDDEEGEFTVTVLKDRHCDTGLTSGPVAVIAGIPLFDNWLALKIKDPPPPLVGTC